MIDDVQIEARLRRIAEPPRPAVPDEVGDYVHGLPLTHPRQRGRVRFVPRTGRATAFLAIAAALVLAVAGLGTWKLMEGPATPVEPGQWTGLEWRDVTGDVPFGWPLRWAGGYAVLDFGDSKLKLSSDALNWTAVAPTPQLAQIVAMPNGLIGLAMVTAPCEGATSCGFAAGKPWLSTDGIDWHQASDLPAVELPMATDPLNDYFRYTLIGDEKAALYATKGVVYVTTDGATWAHAVLPGDMAAAVQRVIQPAWPSGFVAGGLVPNPSGNETIGMTSNTGASYEVIGDRVTWWSADGLTWSRKVVDNSDTTSLHWAGSQGVVRYAQGHLEYSTNGGRTWAVDQQMAGLEVNEYTAGSQLASDGERVVAASWDGPAPTFWASYGDGRWREVGIVGDLSRARSAPMLVTANGVLLCGGERVYFGEAVSGTVPHGALLTPPPTPTPGPSSTPAVSLGTTATR